MYSSYDEFAAYSAAANQHTESPSLKQLLVTDQVNEDAFASKGLNLANSVSNTTGMSAVVLNCDGDFRTSMVPSISSFTF